MVGPFHTGVDVFKPNYQRDKRQRDLARQQKQEEKRKKKLEKDAGVVPQNEAPEALPGEAPEGASQDDL